MKLNVQKRLAGDVMGCSPSRVVLDTDRLEEIKEAITKVDIKSLIKDKAITKKPIKSISKGRTRAKKAQKKKGRQKGHGSRKGKAGARTSRKEVWSNQIRALRTLLKKMKENKLLESAAYRNLYNKAKGGFFRSKKHLKLYIEEKNLVKK